MDDARLRREIERLGPWHLEVPVTPELTTRAWLESSPRAGDAPRDEVSFFDPGPYFRAQLRRIYPAGLEGRSFLDCACNCGAYSFLAKEMGAGTCFGFDVRDRWIEQARFLKENRTVGPSRDMTFEVLDVYDLPAKHLPRFDIAMFKGIFYHLPDPVTALKLVADLTTELIVVNTSITKGLPDGLLAVKTESVEHPMSGVHGLSWYPTGPKVVGDILKWAGFVEARLVWSLPDTGEPLGRIEILASKVPGLLDAAGGEAV